MAPTTRFLVPRNHHHIQRSLPSSRENIFIDEDLLRGLQNCETESKAIKLLQEALRIDQEDRNRDRDTDSDKRSKILFNSVTIPPGASDRRVSDVDLAIQTKIRNGKDSIIDLIELNGDTDRASLAILLLTIFGFSFAVGAEQYLPGPDIVRFIAVWFLSFSPLALVGLGLAAPEKLQRVLIIIQKNFFPTYRRRMIYHEAGHFLIGHLLGLPVKKYQANAVKNAVEFFPLSNSDSGRERAKLLGFQTLVEMKDSVDTSIYQGESNIPYFSPDGRGGKEISIQSVLPSSSKRNKDDYFLKLPSMNDPTKAWPYRGFDHALLDKLSIVSMAGVCSEIIIFGNAEGGSADINQLRQLFNYAQPEIADRDKENKVKFAIGFAIVQLRRHLGALEALVDAMEKDKDIAECILAIEKCTNIEGKDHIEIKPSGILEQIFSRRKKSSLSADFGRDGQILPRLQLSGDDSLYAAMATSVIFLIWAFAGGVTLH